MSSSKKKSAVIKERMHGMGVFFRTNKYAIYVLVMCMLAYMINQLAVFCLVATNIPMANEIEYGDRECSSANDTAVAIYLSESNSTLNVSSQEFCFNNEDACISKLEWNGTQLCYWKYLGKGLEYQLLAGPLYIILFSISGVPMGFIAEFRNINRKLMLFLCVVLWSAMTIFGALCKEYWQVAITRLFLGIFSAGCVPFCASLISDYFSSEYRGTALGFYNWGVYVGYSFTFLLVIAERDLGWRNVYYIAGAPGVVIGVIIMATIKEPKREQPEKEDDTQIKKGNFSKLKEAAGLFSDPVLWLLCIGGAIRNGAGIVFAYNIILFFEEYHPGVDTEEWMTWIPLVFGSIGAFGGGFVSDKLAAKFGMQGRLMVLIVSQMISGPLLLGTLFADMPYCWVSHIFAYMFGEMWIGVLVAVVIELVPAELTASAVSVYFFIIQIIGGNMNLLVPPIEKQIGLRLALVVTFPVMYYVGALFFAISLIVVVRRKKQTKRNRKESIDVDRVDKISTKSDKSSTKSLQADDLVFTQSSDLLGQNDILAIKHVPSEETAEHTKL